MSPPYEARLRSSDDLAEKGLEPPESTQVRREVKAEADAIELGYCRPRPTGSIPVAM